MNHQKHDKHQCATTHNAEELHAQYKCIFPTGNRNAAGHRWAAHLLSIASEVSAKEFDDQARAFCATSGAVVRGSDGSVLDLATTRGGGDRARAMVPHCCWSCACDVMDANDAGRLLLHAESVTTASGEHEVHHLVMSDPCASATFKPPANAPEIQCVDGALQGARRVATSDGEEMVVVGFAFPTSALNSHPTVRCDERAASGYQSGMGGMFRKVAGL